MLFWMMSEGRRTKEKQNASRKHREKMAARQITHPELFDFWQKARYKISEGNYLVMNCIEV